MHHRLLEFSKQQRIFETVHLFLGRSLLFLQSALDLFGCRLGAAAGGVEDAGLQCWATKPGGIPSPDAEFAVQLPDLFSPTSLIARGKWEF